MKNDVEVNDLAEDGADLYPHLKITAEVFPRILATRRIREDDAEYFGAFLTRTAVRILIDLLNRVFRLRSCDIQIDGSFPVPCTQYYRKRCMAPCVASICSREEYDDRVALVKLFLSNNRGALRAALKQEIAISSDALDFERAVEWRDMLVAVEEFWADPRLDVWLDNAVDTYDADETMAGSFIYLVTQRGPRVLGRKVFGLPRGGELPPHEAMERIVSTFYRYHLPREIRVSLDFETRPSVTRELSERFGRPAKITFVRPDRQRVTSARAMQQTWSENELEFVKDKATARQISGELRRSFSMEKLPERVEAFDVAHISGKNFVAASTVWANGEFLPDEHRFHISGETAEPAAMANAVANRLTDDQTAKPHLILLDGGRSQINAVSKLLAAARLDDIPLIGAVKPAGKHSSISHFINARGDRIEYEPDNPAHNMLRLLRDGAHDLANRVHRDLRDMVHHYELAALLPSLTESERRGLVAAVGSLRKIRSADVETLVKLAGSEVSTRVLSDLENETADVCIIPLVVPIRFDSDGDNAEDLIPIETR